MKSYTDLEQSQKLAKILPIESADMYYFLNPTPAGNIYHLVVQRIDFGVRTREPEYDKGDIPCWSLAALLEIIKKLVGYSLQSLDTHTVFMNCELGDKPYNIETENYDNSIDATFAMILKLHEQELL